MSAEIQKTPHPNAPQPTPQRITSVRFVESVPFASSEASHLMMGPGKCDRVTACRIEADGTAVPITSGQRSDGLLFEREWRDATHGNAKSLERVFVGWGNIRCVAY